MSYLKLNHIIKYLLIGLITAISIKYIPTTTLMQEDIIAISIIVSIAYAIIDVILPSVYIYKNDEKEKDKVIII